MIAYPTMTAAQLEAELASVSQQFEDLKQKNLKLDMSRGKPGKVQLDLVSDLLTALQTPADCMDGAMDTRNYGEISGIPSCKALFAELLGCKASQVFVGGSSSLTLMYDVISKAFTHGLTHSPKPWCKEEVVKFLCPSPGYDRHFLVTQSLGCELITIDMTATGPDMDQVEQAIKDPAVKGMWCVPKYSNPTGVTFSDETIDRIAAMKPAAPDFVLMWDNAYCVHELEGEFVPFRDILSLCEANGNADMVFEFASTSKITLPGAGVAVFATSEANLKYMLSLLTFQIISYDKVNQMRHVKYLKDKANTLALMQKHQEIMAPKFRAVVDALDKEIAPLEIGTWARPTGGYFVSYDALPGTAKRALALCKEAGVVMTGAGATFPYGIDPQDSNIRIAPSLPPVAELEAALEVFCTCVKLAALEKLMK
ncbi:MAG: aminotransferase class I/II-fold pyridoxal phosphate-dependent enzyme [Eubacteriales bacterium]